MTEGVPSVLSSHHIDREQLLCRHLDLDIQTYSIASNDEGPAEGSANEAAANKIASKLAFAKRTRYVQSKTLKLGPD